MCTGDNLDTAKSIAVDAGIIDPRASEDQMRYMCMTGQQFREEVGGLVCKEVDDNESANSADKEDETLQNLDRFKEII